MLLDLEAIEGRGRRSSAGAQSILKRSSRDDFFESAGCAMGIDGHRSCRPSVKEAEGVVDEGGADGPFAGLSNQEERWFEDSRFLELPNDALRPDLRSILISLGSV